MPYMITLELSLKSPNDRGTQDSLTLSPNFDGNIGTRIKLPKCSPSAYHVNSTICESGEWYRRRNTLSRNCFMPPLHGAAYTLLLLPLLLLLIFYDIDTVLSEEYIGTS